MHTHPDMSENTEDRQPDSIQPGGDAPEPRGMEGARPDTPEPAGTRKPVQAPESPRVGDQPALPPIQSDAPEAHSDDGDVPASGAATSAVGPAKPKGPSGAKPAGPPARGPKMPPKPVRPPARPPGAKRPGLPPGGRLVPGGDGGGDLPVLTRKDFVSGADVRWCPGCGDYAVLAAVQRVLPDLAENKENVVFISGIGCSSRFPYYMDTYGFHTIHGRAPSVATGLKATRPELDVWVVTGDGDALSIGGNHILHLLRRNLDCQVLLFNNQIYGLTKGQYSPTSEVGKVTKSTPYGSLDHPVNPVQFALGADASFVARTLDRDPKHMQTVLKAAHGHTGTSLVEIYQNCNIFNDGAFFDFTEKESKPERALFVEDGKPLLFAGGARGLRLDGIHLKVADLASGEWSADDCVVYDSTDKALALLVAQQTFWDAEMPRPFGVLYQEDRPTYDALLNAQIEAVVADQGDVSLDDLLRAGQTWTIEA
nr:2-oxoacid:ferredoxin oxidoreductase subunit beta [Rubricoccus marinus]